MKHALPMFLALVVAGALSNKTGDLFSARLAAVLDILIFFTTYIFTYKLFKHFRDL